MSHEYSNPDGPWGKPRPGIKAKPHKVIMACAHGIDFRAFCEGCDTQGGIVMGPTVDEVNDDHGGPLGHGPVCYCTACVEAKLNDIERQPSAADVSRILGEPVVAAHQGRLPVSSEARKGIPIATGCLDYFPDALAEIARLSRIGNDKHNPGQPLHWSRGKSNDHPDCLMRHFLERGTMDTSGAEPVLHSTQMAWRALAILQLEIEAMARDRAER